MMKVSNICKRNGVSLFALAAVSITASTVVHAQDSTERASDEIIVTARLRQESIQSVPIAITALTADDLAKRNISNLNDLTNTTPGISITSIAGGTMQMVYIRGQAPANTTNDLNVEANVGVFIDWPSIPPPFSVAIRQGNDIKTLGLACPLSPFSFETRFEITTHRNLANARRTTYQIDKS